MNILKKISLLVLLLFVALSLPNSKVFAFTITAKPTGVVVSYYDGINSRGFAWQTSTSVTETKVLYVKDNGQTIDWNNATVVTGTTEGSLRGFLYHKAYITELGTGKYYYKVGGNGTYSDVGSFVVDEANDGKVSFTYLTDSQHESAEGFEPFKRCLTAAKKYGPNFVAFGGDLVNNSHNWNGGEETIKMEEWSYALDVPKEIIMNTSFVSTSGNHESGLHTYVNHNTVKFAGTAATGGYYSFDYDNLHFIVLNSNGISSDKTQLEWLENDLASSDKEWKVVLMHNGPYSAGDHSNDGDTIENRNILPPIFAKYKVDLVLQGHDHVYTRTLPYYYGEGENGKIPNRKEKYETIDGLKWSLEPDGTYYVTMNACGTKFYDPEAKGYDTSRIFPGKSPINGKNMALEVKETMFGHIEIDGDSLVMKSYICYEDGSEELFDYIAVKKNTYTSFTDAMDKLNDTVTIKDAKALNEANNLYNNLSERAKLYVNDSYVEKLNGLLQTYDLTDALAAYEAVVAIEKLDSKVLDETFWSNYSYANSIYFNLSETQKELVENKDVLLNMKDNINQSYYVASVQKLIDSIDKSSNKEEARLIALMAYELLSDDAKALITNADILYQVDQNNGCGGSVIASSISILLLGTFIVLIRRKRGECYE